MTHRVHRPPATMPARRGMRASWFRGRAPDELDAPHEHEVPVAHVVVQPPPDAGTLDPTTDPVMPLVRPAFCHPTF